MTTNEVNKLLNIEMRAREAVAGTDLVILDGPYHTRDCQIRIEGWASAAELRRLADAIEGTKVKEVMP